MKAILATPLNARTLKTSEKDGIVTEEVMFHSERDGEKDVEIFGLFCYPKGAKGLPAFVWNQGGLAQASPYFPELGARRGYAALCIDFPMPGYRSTGGYPIVSGLALPEDPRTAPIAHGAVALLKAVSYLQSRPEVDPERIGMAGSSWGGFYTTLMAGLDPRLKAAACMFGCGSLQLGCAWLGGDGGKALRDAAFCERWRTTLDPAWRLQESKTPIAWFSGTDDWFYWMPALMKSYEMAAGPRHLSLLPNWNHALTAALDEQVFAWLDAHLQGKPGFVQVTPLAVFDERHILGFTAIWSYQAPPGREVVSADLILGYGDAGNWPSRCWKTLPAACGNGRCQVRLPDSRIPYYIAGSVTDKEGFRYSTPLVRVEPARYHARGAAAPEFDGAGEWGGFEEGQVSGYLRRHGYPVPALSPDAREGKQAALLKAGTTKLAPLLFTPGIPHRFTFALKADRPAQVTVELAGSFDGKPVSVKKEVAAGTEWAEAGVEFTPPEALVGTLNPSFAVPAGVTVLLDGVHFRPAGKR